jgi:hypothetical protein
MAATRQPLICSSAHVQEAGQSQHLAAGGTSEAAGNYGVAGDSLPTAGQDINNHIKWQPYLLACGKQSDHCLESQETAATDLTRTVFVD